MAQFYSDPRREQAEHALPDCEVFYHNGHNCGEDEEPIEKGWYSWFAFPGCIPDSEPYGPYETEQEAINATREDAEED